MLLRVSLLLAVALVLAAIASWFVMIRMPGSSFRGTPPGLSAAERSLRDELATDVQKLAGEIGQRNLEHYSALQAAADFIDRSFAQAGLPTQRDGYQVGGKLCQNIEAQIAGKRSEIIVIGAHYDSVGGCPGANDNGSGVAALLALARRFAGQSPERTVRFVAFPNEEPGRFMTHEMGSWVYAEGCKKRSEQIAGMISLETIGYFSDARHSQKYPVAGLDLIYPSAGNFIAFVGNIPSRTLVRKAIGAFREKATIPSEGAALPSNVPGIGWSDHWAFWQHGYPAMMLTDTAPFRYPHYHLPSDTPEKLDYAAMARVVAGMQNVIAELANGAH